MWHLNWTPDPPDTIVVGIDEVGFGPLAGPVAMAAVAIPVGAVDGVRDSKLISTERARKEVADAIRATADWVQVRQRGARAINDRGLGRCVREMLIELALAARKKFGYRDVRVVMDGKPLNLPRKFKKRMKVEFQVGADAAVYQVAAASIVAKSHNDANLLALHEKYPVYNFAQHKGYGTPEHIAKLREHGPCKEHRRKPVEKALAKKEHDRDREVLDISREEAKALAEEAWAHREFLSDWQKDFIGDVRRKLERGAVMSPRQNWFIRAAQRESTKRAKRAGAI